MAKAKWKEPPLQRAFGQHPAVQQNKDLKHEIFELKEKLAFVEAQKAAVSTSHSSMRERLQQYESAATRYKWLKAQGVVLEYDGEFKHLKGEDMDKFFEDTQDLRTQYYVQALKKAMVHTKTAVTQTMLYGSRATHIYVDELQELKSWR